MNNLLQVSEISLCPKENAKNHKTKKYEIVHVDNTPVLRRGQKFYVILKFSNKSFNDKVDVLKLIFSCGPHPNPLKGTQGIIKVDDSQKISKKCTWSCEVTKKENKSIQLEICTPYDMPIGLWSLRVQTKNTSEATAKSYSYVNDIYFLCNPWNCNDSTYMPETHLLDEYVLADAGLIWYGSSNRPNCMSWIFGQFDKDILPAVMKIFSRSGLSHSSLGDTIQISRMLSKMVNSNDDNGVIVGDWKNKTDGKNASDWNSSVDILEQYYNSGPVKYGQCWVFAAVVTTICRAIGIPSRVITNFDSAHDSDKTMTIDYFLNKNDEAMENPWNMDDIFGIWNFHVWNEVYITRPDLPVGYGGWQVIDATPQESSDGFSQCGPASLEAVRKGEVAYNYDTYFLISSVNSDVVYWKEDETTELGYSRVSTHTQHVGQLLLTKKPFVDECENVVHLYKMPEGTEGERLQLFNAIKDNEYAKARWEMPDTSFHDVEFSLENVKETLIGKGVNLIVNVVNNSNEVRTVKAVISAGSVYYTGVKSHTIKEAQYVVLVRPNSAEKLTMSLNPDRYMDKLVDHCLINFHAMATVEETGQTWIGKNTFQIMKPEIKINISPKIQARRPVVVTLSLVNPIDKTLSNGKISITGSSMLTRQIVRCKDLRKGETLKVNVTIVPKIKGMLTLVANFTSDELSDISGSAKVTVAA